jgi:predicted patatin/cPLA2 family phospholipase
MQLPFFKKKKKPSEIRMTYTGDIEVIKNVLRKKKLLDKNNKEQEKIKTLLLLPGGGQAGVVEAGGVVALEKLGLRDAFDNIVGISTGAGVGWYFMANETAIGTSIYFDDNVKNHFVNFYRPWKLMDIQTLQSVFQNIKPIDADTFQNARPFFYVGVTELETGNGVFINVKDQKDPLAATVASMCVPIVDGGKCMEINGKKYVDGSIAHPLPISDLIEKFSPTDILILTAYPPHVVKVENRWVQELLNLVVHLLTPGLENAIRTYVDRINKELEYLTRKTQTPNGIRILVVYPEKESISKLSMNKEELENAVFTSKKFTLALFEEAKKEMMTWYEKLTDKIKQFFSA